MTRFGSSRVGFFCLCLSPCYSGLEPEGLKHRFWRTKMQTARLPNTGPFESPELNLPSVLSEEGDVRLKATSSCAGLNIHHGHSYN